jgi:hypothetical protein
MPVGATSSCSGPRRASGSRCGSARLGGGRRGVRCARGAQGRGPGVPTGRGLSRSAVPRAEAPACPRVQPPAAPAPGAPAAFDAAWRASAAVGEACGAPVVPIVAAPACPRVALRVAPQCPGSRTRRAHGCDLQLLRPPARQRLPMRLGARRRRSASRVVRPWCPWSRPRRAHGSRSGSLRGAQGRGPGVPAGATSSCPGPIRSQSCMAAPYAGRRRRQRVALPGGRMRPSAGGCDLPLIRPPARQQLPLRLGARRRQSARHAARPWCPGSWPRRAHGSQSESLRRAQGRKVPGVPAGAASSCSGPRRASGSSCGSACVGGGRLGARRTRGAQGRGPGVRSPACPPASESPT